MPSKITQIRKRDDRIVKFDLEKIAKAIAKALQATQEVGRPEKLAQKLADEAINLINKKFHERSIPAVEEIQDIVEEVLIKNRLIKTAKSYILYRDQHARLRQLEAMIDSDDLIEGYLNKLDWRVKENSNMDYSLQGLNNHVAAAVSAHYWLNKIYPESIRKAHSEGDFHIHDLQLLSSYCCGWDLRDLLLKGFGGVAGKVASKPPKHFRSALGQIVNFFYTMQGEVAGAQALANVDTYLAPFIRYDKLNYNDVRQCLQEFLFNMNVPTRVGFQSLVYDELVVVKENGKIKIREIGRLVDEQFEKNSHRVLEDHPQSYAVKNYDDYQALSFNGKGEAIWSSLKAFVRHRVPRHSEFVKIRTSRGQASVSQAHSLFSFRKLDGSFNVGAKNAEQIRVAHFNEKIEKDNHFVALKTIINQGERKVLDLLDLIEEFSMIHKNVFVKINPTRTVEKIKTKVMEEYQGFLPFYIDFGIRDRGVWQQFLESESIRYDIWRQFGEMNNKEIKMKLKNSEAWTEQRLGGEKLGIFVKLCAWYISEGHNTLTNAFCISQSEKQEIEGLLKSLDSWGYTEKAKGYSKNGSKLKPVYKIFAKGLLANLISLSCGTYSKNKVIPWFIFELEPVLQEDFIKTLMKGDAAEYARYWDYTTTSKKLSLSLSLLLAQNGYKFSVYEEDVKKKNKNWSDQYIIRIYKDKKAKENYSVSDFAARVCGRVEKFNYEREYEYDLSVDLPTENFAGGSGLLMFHNTPFTNVTFDLTPSQIVSQEAVIIGGELKTEKYGEFQEEMDMINKAFAEVMIEGDALGRVFSWPIPTYNITKDFDWNNPVYGPIWEMTAKYGIPYFSNFINSDMKPDDARSMCCRLRLSNVELRKRGGGLFGANPLTGCYDEKTEILTKDGWKFFSDLSEKDEVFTLAENNIMELHKPKRLFKYDYVGELYQFKTKSLDLLVTPNHRMVVDQVQSGKRKFVEAQNFDYNNQRIPKRSIWHGEEKEWFILSSIEFTKYGRQGRTPYKVIRGSLKINMDDWLKFFGFWLAEGCTDNEKIAKRHGYRTVVSQVNQKKQEEIRKVLDDLPFNYAFEEKMNFVICNKQLWTYLRQFGNKYQKFIPQKIKELSKRQLKILFDWMVKGDGHVRKTTGQINYWTASKRLSDDLQEVILKLGWLGTSIARQKKIKRIKGVRIKAGVVYTIGVQKAKHYRLRENTISKVPYRGKVYCCEVENHTVFVRRNGKVSWCGNSLGVVTLNLPRAGYLSKDTDEFKERIGILMDLAKESLELKRKILERFTEAGLYPYCRFYLRDIKKRFNEYWKNHFNTIGLNGMNEALLNLIDKDITSEKGHALAKETLDFMRERLKQYQAETNNLYNLEATPAEGTAYRFARLDKKKYADIITANEEAYQKEKAAPYYTNSTHLPVGHTNDIFTALDKQDDLQTLYTGGTVLHGFLGEKMPSGAAVKKLVKKIAENYHLPYYTITPTFSVCPKHGYLAGEHFYCPKCDEEAG